MKVDLGQGVKYDDEAEVTVFPSATREGMLHYVMYFLTENTYRCSCEGFQYNRHCKHVDKVQKESV